MNRQVTIIGNNIASLVAGIALAEKKYDINIINPFPSWGGHFGGITVDNTCFDCGMTFFEFDSFQPNQSHDVLNYEPSLRNDCGRFTTLARNYVEQLIRTKPVPKPQMFLQGRVTNDIMITNNLTSLISLQDNFKQEIKQELLTILTSSEKGLHAVNKVNSDLFITNNFHSISVANHGKLFHSLFIEPFSKKVSFRSSRDFLALYHRVFWLPLYYPETLLSQFDTKPQILKPTQFYYPAQGYMGAFVNALVLKAQSNNKINIQKKSIASILFSDRYKVCCNDNSIFETNKLAWGLDISLLSDMFEKDRQHTGYERTSITLCFIGVASEMIDKEYSTLFVLDKEYISYRITNQNVCAGSEEEVTRIVIELNNDFAISKQIDDDLRLRYKLENELMSLNIIKSRDAVKYFHVKHLKDVLIFPSKHSYESFVHAKATVMKHRPDLKLTGAASGFMTASLNDQIIQGLQIAKQLED